MSGRWQVLRHNVLQCKELKESNERKNPQDEHQKNPVDYIFAKNEQMFVLRLYKFSFLWYIKPRFEGKLRIDWNKMYEKEENHG